MQYDKQYRQTVLNNAMVVYQVNLTQDRIENEFTQNSGGGKVPVLPVVDMSAPCSYDEYCYRWSRRVTDDSLSAYRRMDSCEKLLDIYKQGITTKSIQYNTRDIYGKSVWINKSIQMSDDEDSKDILGLVCLQDITDQYKQQNMVQEMKKKITQDLLTGLLNHVSGEMLIRERLLARTDQEYVLFLFDVDGFKMINDSRGHQFGDQILKRVGEILEQACRMKDIAVRVGGDEFVLFLNKPEDLDGMVERIFQKLCFRHKGFDVTVSMGISTTTECGRDYSQLFYYADQAMYLSKRRGKGCYSIFRKENPKIVQPVHQKGMLGENLLDEDKFASVRSLLRVFSENMNDYLFISDLVNDTFFISRSAVERFSLPSDIIYNMQEAQKSFVYSPDMHLLEESIEAIRLGKSEGHNICYRWISRSRQPVWINCRGSVIRNDEGEPIFLIGCINEIGARQMADNVSGLLGEASLEKRCNELRGAGSDGFLMRIGIDGFRQINEQYGSKYGDFILRSTVLCMEKCIDENQELYRMQGDEFIVLDYSNGDDNAGKNMYRKIRRSVEEMIVNMGYDVMFTISGGIISGKNLEYIGYSEAMKRTQFALDHAKQSGRNQYYVFEMEEYEKALRRNTLLQEIRKSVRNNYAGFQVVYQPIVNARTNEIYIAEALLRYTRENGERISPGSFISVLEDSGLIVPVGKWIIQKCAQICSRCRKIRPDFRISLNVSPVQFEKSSVYTDLKMTLEKYGLPNDALVVEVTESHKLAEACTLHKNWDRMRSRGFTVAVDDFGSGYSNFSNISVINPSILKLDRAFTLRAVKNGFDRNLMKNIIDLAHELGMQVCVEGVELADEVEYISQLQPDYLQGFYFGRPSAPEEFFKMLEQ